MKRTQKQPHELSLLELLQEVESRTCTETIPADQQQSMEQVMIHILQACAKTREHLLPRQDIEEIRGQAHVKRALEAAAAGRHSILLVGPPGAGKARLARTVPSLLPTTSLPYPLREPPSSIGRNAFIGDQTMPGELILAHGGMLLLKDLDTFDLSLLTLLAQTVKTQVISLPSQEGGLVLPGQFLLVATVKPCPCGFSGDPVRACLCSVEEIARYRLRIQEVVRTCFDIEIEVPLTGEEILSTRPEESSARIRQRVEAAHEMQKGRHTGTTHLWVNADLGSADEVRYYCPLDSPGEQLLKAALRQLQLSPRQTLRVQGVARTIADLAGSPVIQAKHVAEAIQYVSRFIR